MNEIFTLKNADSVLTAEVTDTGWSILSMKTASGIEMISPAPAALPAFCLTTQVRGPMKWKSVSCEYDEAGARILFEDKRPNVNQELEITVSVKNESRGPFEINAKWSNKSRFGTRIWPGNWFSVCFADENDTTAMRVHKESGVAQGWNWNNAPLNRNQYPGTGICRDKLEKGKAIDNVTTTCQDFNSNGYIPMVYFDRADKGAYVGIEWTSCCIRAEGGESGSTASVNLLDGFSTRIPVGKEFLFPTVYLGVYDGDVDTGSNVFKRWFWDYKVPSILREDEGEPYTQMDMQLGTRIEGLGIESIKWDYGWWNDPEHEKFTQGDDSLEGDWTFRQQWRAKLLGFEEPATLRQCRDKIRTVAKNYALYVLLHETTLDIPDSLNSTRHPEWFSDRVVQRGRVADLGNEECVEFCKDRMLRLFKESGAQTWRSDFEPICYRSDKANRHDANGTDVMYWATVGFCDLVDHMYANYPGFRYESCSSGGSMKDFKTMTKCVVVNNDDSCNYNSLRASFYDASYCFCPAQLQAPTNPDNFVPESKGWYTPPADVDYGFRSTIISVPMVASWSTKPREGDTHIRFNLEEAYAKYLNLYIEKIRPLQRHGDLWHILGRPDNIHWDGVQYSWKDSPFETKGAAFLFKPCADDGETKTVRIRGLYPDRSYRLVFSDHPEQNAVYTGSALDAGIVVTMKEDVASELIWIEEEN